MRSRSDDEGEFTSDARTIWTEMGLAKGADGAALYMSALRGQQAMLYQVEGALRPLSLSFARFSILFHLSRRGRSASSLGTISASMGVHPASITKAVDRLEGDGLVRREPHPSSGRTTLARITPEGRALCRRATAALNILFKNPPLEGEELESYIFLSNKILSVFND
jgi:DNA-binding MarR family transcriptional regulator